MKSQWLCTFCKIDWPCLCLTWLSEETLNTEITHWVWDKVSKPLLKCQPDQFSPINPWLELCQNPLPWLCACTCQEKETLLVIKADQSNQRSPIKNSPKIKPDEDFPPPYMGGHPDLPDLPPLPLEIATVPHQPPASLLDSPAQYPLTTPLLPSPQEPHTLSPIGHQFCPSHLQMTLQGYPGTRGPNQPSALYYQSFSSTGLLSWKQHTPSYSEKPQAMIDLLALIFQMHQWTWDDCWHILLILVSTEEHSHIIKERWASLKTRIPDDDVDLDTWVNSVFPTTLTNWDFNTAEGHKFLTEYWKAFLAGIKVEGEPINMFKSSEITQELRESPTKFYEGLC